MSDNKIFKTHFSQRFCASVEMLIKFKFPDIENLQVEMNEFGEVYIIFDEGKYTGKEVDEYVQSAKKEFARKK